ncbi:MAG TPA: replicative DNA helicase, partial [Anaerolineales bacterium]|nr:replicative DNA helicase [Anaerolineales bacterium]
EAVLGAVLIDSEVYLDVSQLLNADDFYSVKHAWIWESFANLQKSSMPIDLLTVQEDLSRLERLEEVGGIAYLTRLITHVPTAFNAVAYGKLVEESAIRRRLLKAASDIAALAYDQKTAIEEVMDSANKAMLTVQATNGNNALESIRNVASSYYDQVKYLYDHRGEPMGTPTGFRDLDKLLGGFQRSDLLIIAGRPGQGKSGFMISVAVAAAMRYRKQVAIFSLEMSNDQVVQRMIAQETGISTHALRQGQMKEEDWPKFTEAVSRLSELGIFLDDTPGITPMQLLNKCRRLKNEVQLDLIVLDYLQLMQGDSRGKDGNRVQEVSQISRSLKLLAREMSCPVLAGAQLSRGVEQRTGQRPMLSDLRESGSIEQDADVVMFLHHPDAWDEDPLRKNVTEIIVAKHRNGPTGDVPLVFLDSLTKFVDGVRDELNLNPTH